MEMSVWKVLLIYRVMEPNSTLPLSTLQAHWGLLAELLWFSLTNPAAAGFLHISKYMEVASDWIHRHDTHTFQFSVIETETLTEL